MSWHTLTKTLEYRSAKKEVAGMIADATKPLEARIAELEILVSWLRNPQRERDEQADRASQREHVFPSQVAREPNPR